MEIKYGDKTYILTFCLKTAKSHLCARTHTIYYFHLNITLRSLRRCHKVYRYTDMLTTRADISLDFVSSYFLVSRMAVNVHLFDRDGISSVVRASHDWQHSDWARAWECAPIQHSNKWKGEGLACWTNRHIQKRKRRIISDALSKTGFNFLRCTHVWLPPPLPPFTWLSERREGAHPPPDHAHFSFLLPYSG